LAADLMPHIEIHRQFFPIQKGWQFPKYPGKTLIYTTTSITI